MFSFAGLNKINLSCSFVLKVINGLMQREDWERAIKLPVGCLPGGSGNALACALNHAAK